MKKDYVSPQINVVSIISEDIITISNRQAKLPKKDIFVINKSDIDF